MELRCLLRGWRGLGCERWCDEEIVGGIAACAGLLQYGHITKMWLDKSVGGW